MNMAMIDAVAVELASDEDIALVSNLAKWIAIEQERLDTMAAAGYTLAEAVHFMNQGDAQ